MVYTEGQNGNNQLVYSETILCLNKEDNIIFEVKNDYLDYKFKFIFRNDGEKYSTTYFPDETNRELTYQLHNWDSNSYVEISKAIILRDDSFGNFLIKFRNQSLESKNHRKFTLTIWKPLN